MFHHPMWQAGRGVNNRYTQGQRQLPDVSAVADSVPIYYQSHWQAWGGTSAATPIWAMGLALVNEDLLQQRQSVFYGPGIFYQVAQHAASQHLQPYFDVTEGNNLYYPATAGWDYATGLGTPNLPNFTRSF